MSVFANKDLPKGTVLGAYAGKLHRSDKELNEAKRKNGTLATLTYLFGTSSKHQSVDGHLWGNDLRYINTADKNQLEACAIKNESPEKDMLIKVPTEKDIPIEPNLENNVSTVRMGKNVIICVINKDTPEGTELYMSYGPYFDPFLGSKELFKNK